MSNELEMMINCCFHKVIYFQDKIQNQSFAKLCKIEINPSAVIEESNAIENFISYLEPFLQPQSIQERLPPSDVVGNIRFSHPTLYVFPGGQGDSALFGINGFNMLIDGGFSRKACFWDFTRHLDRLDAILVTRMSDENTQGINAVLERKTVNPVYPQIGHMFANILESKKDRERETEREKIDDEERDKLLVNVVHEGNTMMENLRILNLKPQICFRDNICDPINLYHKVGHGKLDMYVLNPSKESREVREFLSRWNEESGHLGKFKSGINVDGKELWLPIANLVSICALIIWYPANPNDTITRLLFPGSTPQHKIFKGLEKLKRLECLRQPVCSPSSIQESASKSERRKKVPKSTDSNRGIPSDNTNLEKKEKLAKRRLEKLRKEKEEREKQEKEKKEEKEKRDKEKEEHEKADKEKKDKERAEKTEKKKKAEQERKAKERQERKEREASIAAARKEKEEKEAASKKEREEKDAAAKKEREEREASAKKEREASRKEREEKRKEREAKAQKDLENKKEMSEPRTNDVVIKKKVSSTSTKSKLKESSVRSKTTDTAISTRKIMPSKPTAAKLVTPPPSKLKKDENNKKVMENRKAAAIKKSKPDNDEKLKVKKVIKKPKPAEEGRTVDEQSVAEKVSEAIASGEIDNSRVIKDNDQDDKEPVVEMESCQPEELEAGQDEDEDDIELQRIKDEEEEDNQEPVPDIAEKMADVLKEEENLHPVEAGPNIELKQGPAPLVLEKQEKISYTHVKTPDEVDDLPEHEVVAHEINIVTDIENVNEETIDHEEKIVNDEKEKENRNDSEKQSEESIEAVRDNEIVEVAVEQKILQKQEDRSPDESEKDEPCIEKEDFESNEKDVKIIAPKEEDSKQESVKSECSKKETFPDPKTVQTAANKVTSPTKSSESKIPFSIGSDIKGDEENQSSKEEAEKPRKSPLKETSDEAVPDRKSSISVEENKMPNDQETICKDETKNDSTEDREDTIEDGSSIVKKSPIFEKVDIDKMIEQNQDDTKEEKCVDDTPQDITETTIASKSEDQPKTDSLITDRKDSLADKDIIASKSEEAEKSLTDTSEFERKTSMTTTEIQDDTQVHSSKAVTSPKT